MAADKIHSRVEELTKVLCKRSLASVRGSKRATLAALPDPTHSLAVSQEALQECVRVIAEAMKQGKAK
ncbi:MAG: hypothetical protein QM703_07140 [Gemmatales bacterium]